jgi:hypothetical protein
MDNKKALELAKKYININAVDNCVVSVNGDVYYNTDIELLKKTFKADELFILKGKGQTIEVEFTEVKETEAVAEPIKPKKKK